MKDKTLKLENFNRRNKEISELTNLLEKAGYTVIVSPRHAMGNPCFHCGTKLSDCREMPKTTGYPRCCIKCKGNASH